MARLICGIGVNDADYTTRPSKGGVMVTCQFYRAWKDMIERCYSEKLQARKPMYKGCSVCGEWLIFSNFKAWMQQQDWQGKELDKDILVKGNKVYSPSTCAFVDTLTNTFVTDSRSKKSSLPSGAFWHKNRNNYGSACKNPFSKRLEYLGSYDNPLDAHLAWKKRKHEFACQLAELQSNPCVAEALRNRYV